jgi:hypothetical protein
MFDGTPMRPSMAISRAVVNAANRARRRRKLAAAIEATQPISSAGLSAELMAETAPAEAAALVRYLGSASFEQAVFQLVTGRFLAGGHRDRGEELTTAVRAAIRAGLTHFVGPHDERTVLLADALIREVHAAVDLTGINPSTIAEYGTLELAAVGYHASAAIRNSELLTSLQSLAGIHRFTADLRTQIAALHSHMRLPHVKGIKSVPFDKLYVQPKFPDMRTIFEDPKASWTAGWTRIGQRTVVLGDPGAGKSTFAAKLVHDLVRDNDQPLIPFLVVLRELTDRIAAGTHGLPDFLEDRCRAPYHVEPPAGAVDYLLLNGEAIVILDGLDELTDVALRGRVVELIEGFVHRYPDVPVVVTSRRVGYELVPLPGHLFNVVGLGSFDDDDVRRYASLWFVNESAARPEAKGLTDAFIRDTQLVPDLRGNPLLLSLLCSIYVFEHYIPDNRPEVYERCATMLFQQWDQLRGVKAARIASSAYPVISFLAWQMYRSGQQPVAARSTILREITDYLLTRRYDDEDLAREWAQDFLTLCSGRAWILAEVGGTDREALYGFTHRTFLEYFTAEHLVRSATGTAAIFEWLRPRIAAGESIEVANLVLQVLDRKAEGAAGALLDLALTEASGPGRTARTRARFLTFACHSLEFFQPAPATLNRIVAAAVGQAATVTVQQRLKATDTITEDEGLGLILSRASPRNLPMLQRALPRGLSGEDRQEGAALAGAHLHQLVTPDRAALLSGTGPAVAAAAAAAGVDSSWWWELRDCQRELTPLPEVLSRHGSTVLFMSLRIWQSSVPSFAADLFTRAHGALERFPHGSSGTLLPWSEQLWTILQGHPPLLSRNAPLAEGTYAAALSLVTAVLRNYCLEQARGFVMLALPVLELLIRNEDQMMRRSLGSGRMMSLLNARKQSQHMPHVVVDLTRNASPDTVGLLSRWIGGQDSYLLST